MDITPKVNESGAVSIFIVVFTALLVTIVTTGFIQIMLRNQQQASNNDLSQSAYDSALAGVEDAKRALVKLKECQQNNDPCEVQVRQALKDRNCDSLEAAGIVDFNDNGEVIVGDESLNQAYTCVKVQLDTEYVDGDLIGDDQSRVIKLDGKESFNRIRLSWFTADDIMKQQEDSPSPGAMESEPDFTVNPVELPSRNTWPKLQPPIMRSQLIQFKKGDIKLSSFNDNAKTLFLYPSELSGSPSANFSADTRRDSGSRNAPRPAPCNSNFNTDAYLCHVTITLPAMENREAYLQLAAYYNNTSYKIELLDDDAVVPFDGVQPQVDSTGRAGDLFRRVKASISVSDGGVPLQFPDAALTIEGSLCKDFFVTDKKADYQADTDSIPCELASGPTTPPTP